MSLKTEHHFAIYSTAYGDGEYTDNKTVNKYSVDSGTIGCIPLEFAIERNSVKEMRRLGGIVEFADDFCTGLNGDNIVFGDIEIST